MVAASRTLAVWAVSWLAPSAIARHTLSCVRLKLWQSKNAMADDKVETCEGRN